MSLVNHQDHLPKVAIIGRPNVGKSTLFNILTDTRKAVVKDEPGVTRDIQMELADVWGKAFWLIDTGGVTEASDLFSQLIRKQVSEFLSEVDLLILVMDGRAGLIPEDREIIRLAKSVGKPFILCVNKVDSVADTELSKAEFYEFGGDVISCSFERRLGLSELLEWLDGKLKTQSSEIFEGCSIAIVGKPNVGKSSLVNALLGEERMLVSDQAGTTVDSIDTPFLYEGEKYRLIDTAGLRRSSRREEDVEIISAFKSEESIRRADIVLLVVDVLIGPTDQDSKILASVLESHRAVILVGNKSDLGHQEIENFKNHFRSQVENEFHYFPDIPMVFTSAKTGRGLKDLLTLIQDIKGKINKRISTSQLNDFFFKTIRQAPAPVWGNTNVKFFYLTQTHQVPPAFIAFANHPDGVTPSYRRFLIKNLKNEFDLSGIPIRIFVMKGRESKRSGGA